MADCTPTDWAAPDDPTRHLGSRQWINAYEVTRHCGGPEEGGWYYDVGTPLASVPVDTEGEAHAARQMLKAKFHDDYVDRRTRFSVIGEEDLIITMEDAPAEPWPLEIPRYE